MIRPAVASLLASLALIAAGPPDDVINAPDLTRRADLLGREVTVDERVRYFESHNKGRDYDTVLLRRTPVVFRLPPRLRPKELPRAPAARVRGILRRDGDDLICDVEELEIEPDDLERLNRGVAVLGANDAEGRYAWAGWASRRAAAYQDPKIDPKLVERSQALIGDALRIEAGRPSPNPAKHWLSLARRARAEGVPEPEPSALAHRGFRAKLASSRTASELKALVVEIGTFFPEAPRPPPAGSDPTSWLARYEKEPDVVTRAAPAPVRVALNHLLWADAAERSLVLQAAEDSKSAVALADQAAERLPERPEVASRLLEQGLDAQARDLGALRLREVQDLARAYADRLHKPERGRGLLRDWLDDQRARHLSPSDAEGRLALASLYEQLLDDRETALDLIRAAWKIDPGSKDVVDAFRRRNFQKNPSGDWVERPRATAAEAPDVPRRPAAGRSGRLLGSTPEEVVRLNGKPDRIVWSASQGQVIEQWIYLGPDRNQYVNFLRAASDPHPKVVASYFLRRIVADRTPPRN